MSTINPLARELNVKVVYYGPGLSGKTTTLKHIHERIRPESRGELLTFSTEGDRTLFFDYLPVLLEPVNDLPIRLQLYTVPGQVFYDATRKLVLSGADGVVFVADSQRAQADQNSASLENLEQNLAELGIALNRFPFVIQYNKRDLPDVLPVADMHASLNRFNVPEFESVANEGRGVFAAFKQVVRIAVDRIRAELNANAGSPTPSEAFEPHDLRSTAAPTLTPVAQVAGAFSFRKVSNVWGPALVRIEEAIHEQKFGLAISMAAGTLADLFASLPPRNVPPASKVALLGLDGREYLRLAHLVGQPDAALQEKDALFALYLAVAAAVKVQGI